MLSLITQNMPHIRFPLFTKGSNGEEWVPPFGLCRINETHVSIFRDDLRLDSWKTRVRVVTQKNHINSHNSALCFLRV